MNEILSAHVSHRALLQFYEHALQAYINRVAELEKEVKNLKDVVESLKPRVQG